MGPLATPRFFTPGPILSRFTRILLLKKEFRHHAEREAFQFICGSYVVFIQLIYRLSYLIHLALNYHTYLTFGAQATQIFLEIYKLNYFHNCCRHKFLGRELF